MERAFFIMFPAKGHINAVLGMAKAMMDLQIEVLFSGGTESFLDFYVEMQGIKVVRLNSVPFGMKYEDEVNYYKKVGKNKKDVITNRFLDKNYTSRRKSLEDAIDEVKPSIILLDSFIGSDFLSLYPYLIKNKIKFCFVNTMSIFKGANLPPANSYLLPHQKSMIKIFYLRNYLKQVFKEGYENLFLLGKSTKNNILKKVNDLNVSPKYQIISNYPLNITFSNVTELILNYKEFDFPQAINNLNKIYIGPLLYVKRKELIKRDDLERYQDIIKGEEQIIYISFGTMFSSKKYESLIQSFIKKIFSISYLIKDTKYIISYIKEGYKSKFGVIPSNVFLFSSLPQTSVLSKSTIFITHGGLNSIKESMHYQVPMIVYPVNQEYDQPGNASRVLYHKIGLIGSLKKDSEQDIFCKIKELLKNNIYRENLIKIKIDSDKKYNKSSFLEVLNKDMNCLFP